MLLNLTKARETTRISGKFCKKLILVNFIEQLQLIQINCVVIEAKTLIITNFNVITVFSLHR